MKPDPAATTSDASMARQLASLGTGTADDRLGFRAVLHIFGRSVPLLRPVAKHLALLVVLLIIGLAILLPIGWLGLNAMWQGVLQGKPVLKTVAAVFGLDPAVFCGTEPL